MKDQAWVYILASLTRVLYVGVTSDIEKRISEHKLGVFDGFTKKYRIHNLVWCETFARIDEAIDFEKRLKKWRREWKIELIEKTNPGWNDLGAG